MMPDERVMHERKSDLLLVINQTLKTEFLQDLNLHLQSEVKNLVKQKNKIKSAAYGNCSA